jgi:hypothetical protein
MLEKSALYISLHGLTFRHTRLIFAEYFNLKEHYSLSALKFCDHNVFAISEDGLYDRIFNLKFEFNLKNPRGAVVRASGA